MKIKVGLIGVEGVSVTLYRDPKMDKAEMRDVTPQNASRVGVAIARRELDSNVFPIEVRL